MVVESTKKVLVIGSGPIIIGQAAEFDYAGTQACKALREEGVTCVLVNSNPATIMTDEGIADITYIEPLTVEFVRRIIERERPDGLLPTLGGQVGLNLAVSLSQAGVLDEFGVRLLGTPLASIQQAEDRELFKRLLLRIGEPVPPSASVTQVDAARAFADEIGFPLIVRPSFTLGGTGGGVATTVAELEAVVARGLASSPIQQVLVEQYLVGWKEIEYEVMRDSSDTCVTVCNMENVDPMGVHTGDSIVVAPSQTLSDKEYLLLRSAAFKIIRALGVEGGCNVQFALDSRSSCYYVIEVNPRISRSSALASKATGYPIARVAAKIALGKRLDEITNAATGTTCAAFEPALDYVVVKIPRWPFDKFPQADRHIGTQMKATGEVMAIAPIFEAALQKAVRALELDGRDLLWQPTERDEAFQPSDQRLWQLMAALRADSSGHMLYRLYRTTGIDSFFLVKLRRLIKMEQSLRNDRLTPLLLSLAKCIGFSDRQIAILTGKTVEFIRGERLRCGIRPTFKMVDTCAGEFAAQTAYFYSTYGAENEALPLGGPSALVLGSGPIRIGQGIEFDYCSVQAARALHLSGWHSIMVNSNPETVSTDFDLSDRLYFEPLDEESVRDILENEAGNVDTPASSTVPTMVQFGGQTAINLTGVLAQHQMEILGTSAEGIDAAEDRRQFQVLLTRLGIPSPIGRTVNTLAEALATAQDIGYPLLVRPSYVLGGRAMEIVYGRASLESYVKQALKLYGAKPLLIDRYLAGKEVEVDLVADGKEVLIPGIMEHIERAGIHSGDSSAVYPPITLTQSEIETIARYSTDIALALGVRGLLNAQYVVTDDGVFVLEVNPRASRTVPFLSKATGVPMVTVATQIMLGQTLAELGYSGGLCPVQPLFAVKVPVFSLSKLPGLETALGPEMRSTGEVMGIDCSYIAALSKAYLAAGLDIPVKGRALVSLAKRDRVEEKAILLALAESGYIFYAPASTANLLQEFGIVVTVVDSLYQDNLTILNLIHTHKIDLVIDTVKRHTTASANGSVPQEGATLRRAAVEAHIPCFTCLDTVRAAIETMRRSDVCCEVRPFVEYRRSLGL